LVVFGGRENGFTTETQRQRGTEKNGIEEKEDKKRGRRGRGRRRRRRESCAGEGARSAAADEANELDAIARDEHTGGVVAFGDEGAIHFGGAGGLAEARKFDEAAHGGGGRYAAVFAVHTDEDGVGGWLRGSHEEW
jgi:hypothetical protein